MPRKVENLVVDTSAFIKNAQLQDFGKNLITTEDVVNEIKNSRQLRRLAVLPYDLQLSRAELDNLGIVMEFAKKTGDYPALSPADLQVLALTYQLEKELVGSEHLRTEPAAPKSVEPVYHTQTHTNITGFYLPSSDTDENSESCSEQSETGESDDDDFEDCEQEVPEIDEELVNRLNSMTCQEQLSKECDQNDPCALDDDDAGWITPGNINKRLITDEDSTEVESIKVACLTTDFAMQNVLKQMGLNVISIDGLVIKEVRTYILRCYACFKTTSIMTKVFCPNCGHKTLKRVAVTVDEDGKEHIHINFRRPLTARGKRFPLPRFQGGKHSNNPVLSEDQKVPQQKMSKLANQKNNPLDSDYLARVSPFLMRDVSSKSAILGVQRKVELKSWMRKNPNEVVKRRRKK